MPDTDPQTLFALFREIGIIEQLSRARLEAQLPPGLIAPHFAVLSHLTIRGSGATPIHMARAFQVPKTSMTHTLKGLEKGGYVELRPNPDDGRSKTVWITQAGTALFQHTITAMAPGMGTLLQKIDIAKLTEILPVLSELRSVMDAARDP